MNLSNLTYSYLNLIRLKSSVSSRWWQKDYICYTCPKHFYYNLSKKESIKNASRSHSLGK